MSSLSLLWVHKIVHIFAHYNWYTTLECNEQSWLFDEFSHLSSMLNIVRCWWKVIDIFSFGSFTPSSNKTHPMASALTIIHLRFQNLIVSFLETSFTIHDRCDCDAFAQLEFNFFRWSFLFRVIFFHLLLSSSHLIGEYDYNFSITIMAVVAIKFLSFLHLNSIRNISSHRHMYHSFSLKSINHGALNTKDSIQKI